MGRPTDERKMQFDVSLMAGVVQDTVASKRKISTVVQALLTLGEDRTEEHFCRNTPCLERVFTPLL